MEFKDKINQSVAAAVAKIMEKTLHSNQQKIDVVDDEKIDGKDFAKLRKMRKEEAEQQNEAMEKKTDFMDRQKRLAIASTETVKDSKRLERLSKIPGYTAAMDLAKKTTKEEVEIEEESHQSKTTMKHIPNASPALKQAAKDIKPGVGGYRDRIAMLKAGGVKEEVEELDELSKSTLSSYLDKKKSEYMKGKTQSGSKENAKDIQNMGKAHDKMKKEEVVDESLLGQLRDRGNVVTGQKQQDRKNFDTNTGAALKPNSTISGIRAKMQNKVQEESEQIDELSKSTLGSYIKKAAADSTISRKIGADFENRANSKRSPAMKDASTALSDKFKSDSRKRKANVDKAVDRLTKEEKQPKTLRQFKEGWEEMMADVKKRAEPKPNGGSGVKQGSRYGGSKQKDTPEQDTEKK